MLISRIPENIKKSLTWPKFPGIFVPLLTLPPHSPSCILTCRTYSCFRFSMLFFPLPRILFPGIRKAHSLVPQASLFWNTAISGCPYLKKPPSYIYSHYIPFYGLALFASFLYLGLPRMTLYIFSFIINLFH